MVPIVSGVFIATVTELSFDLVGMVAALSATILFAVQNIYSKKVSLAVFKALTSSSYTKKLYVT